MCVGLHILAVRMPFGFLGTQGQALHPEEIETKGNVAMFRMVGMF